MHDHIGFLAGTTNFTPELPVVLLVDDRPEIAIHIADKLMSKGYQTLWAGSVGQVRLRCVGEERETRRDTRKLWGVDSFGSVIVHKDFRGTDGENAWDVIQELRKQGGDNKPVILTSGEYDFGVDTSRTMLALGAQYGCNLLTNYVWSGSDWDKLDWWLRKSKLNSSELYARENMMELNKAHLSNFETRFPGRKER